MNSEKLTDLQSETDELGKILTTYIKNAKETESDR